jgi:hypothetical protein
LGGSHGDYQVKLVGNMNETQKITCRTVTGPKVHKAEERICNLIQPGTMTIGVLLRTMRQDTQ